MSMEILKRSHAPITSDAWEEIDDQARNDLTGFISARKVLDVKGPKGWKFSAVRLGSVEPQKNTAFKGVNYGLRENMAMVEVRVPFSLSISEMDDVSRGSYTPDFTNLTNAARELILFEETAIYKGLSDASIQGMESAAENPPVVLDGMTEEPIALAVGNAVLALRERGIEGPYSLICGPQLWEKINVLGHSYPLKRRIQDLIGGRLILSRLVDTCLLVSERGGDTELVLGQDISIGYSGRTETDINLYFLETFTFRVLEPEAIVYIKVKSKKDK